MSRPPRPHFRVSTAGDQDGRRDQFDYLPTEHRGFVELQKELASSEAGLTTTGAEGDFTNTMMEASAVLAHLLGVYQDVYAREAYLLTATSPRSLVHHARRLAYQPDQGLSATGHAVLTVGDGLEGTIEQGFSLASVPQGDIKAQDYETLEAVAVRAEWNALQPSHSTLPVATKFNAKGESTLRLVGTGYGLEPGDSVLLVGPSSHTSASGSAYALIVDLARELDDSKGTDLDVSSGPLSVVLPPAEYRLLARPRASYRPFAWNANPAQFPPAAVQTTGGYSAPDPNSAAVGDTQIGYNGTPEPQDIFLDSAVNEPLLGSWMIHLGNGTPHRVVAEDLQSVVLHRGEIIGVPEPLFYSNGTPQIENGRVKTAIGKQLVETQVANTVTTLRLETVGGNASTRPSLTFPSTWVADFELDIALATRRPNPAVVSQPVAFADDLSGLEPGRFVVLSNLDETVSQVVSVQKISIDSASEESLLHWNPVSPSQSFRLEDFKVFANVTEIAHGQSKTETLGGSDGVTPFLSFALKENPTSQLPGKDGGEPAIEVRIHAVRWERVADFNSSGPEDRHYRIEIDDQQGTTVIFGDGKHGAIPPLGKKHITAIYKLGLGAAGNAGSGRVSRIKKAHPLVERAWNPTPMRGGAAPANPDDVRRQATRYVRTFDRAVSVQDHADLALLFPGVTRAAASWSDRYGIELVVADAAGSAPADKAAVEAFLEQRRDTGVPLRLVDPEPIDIHLTVNVEHDPAHLSEKVKLAVQQALYGAAEHSPGMFTFSVRAFGQAVNLSEVYARIARVPGVDYVAVSCFAFQPTGVYDVLRASAAQWLRLPPSQATVLASKVKAS